MNDFFNPLDKYWRVSRCAICDSRMHWADKCPHNKKNVKKENIHCNEANRNAGGTSSSDEMDEYATLITIPTAKILMAQADENCAIIDTGCLQTVCGQSWFDCYYSSLSINQKKDVRIYDSNTAFKFGDGKTVYSSAVIKLPAMLGGRKCAIECNVVPTNIPLLLSKVSMKKAKVVIDCGNDKVMAFGAEVPVKLTNNGHYCVNIIPNMSHDNSIKNCMLSSDDK